METRAAYTIIGGFLLAAMGLAFLFILYLGSGQTEYDPYLIIFDEQVSGLNQGAAVRYSGIQVGEVRSLDINEMGQVEALVRVDKKTPIKTDTIAKLELVGFTGLAVIQFEGGSPNAERLKNTVQGTPVIKAAPSAVGQLLAGSEELVEAVNAVLSKENVSNISSIIKNVDVLTQTFADSSDDIAVTLANAAQLTEDLARASDDLDRLLKDLDVLANAEGKAALANVEQVAAEARLLVSELNGIAKENRQNLKAFTSTGLQQVGPGLTEVRRLVRTMDSFLRQLERDPRGYLLGEPVPEYKAETVGRKNTRSTTDQE